MKSPRKKKRPDETTQPENLPEDLPETKETPSKDQEKPSQEEVARTWTDPVTNQDEQEKITNAGGEDLPVPDK